MVGAVKRRRCNSVMRRWGMSVRWGNEARLPCADEGWGAVAGACPHCSAVLVVEEQASSVLAAQARGGKEREPSEWQQAQEEISLISVASPTSFV